MAKKIAATVGKDITGKQKYEIMRSAVSRYNTAMEHNFYLEATALIESLIANRLESRLAELTSDEVEIDTLGNLIKKINKSELEPDAELSSIMNKKIIIWCKKRNITIHRAAKLLKDEKKDFAQFLEAAKDTATEGRKIYDQYNKRLNQLRKK